MDSGDANRFIRSYVSVVIFLLVGCGSGIGLFGKLPLLQTVFQLPQAVLAMGCAVLICLPLLWKVAVRYHWLAALTFAVLLTVVSLVVLPRTSRLHAMGHGSDQAACIIVATNQLTAFKWPYDENLMWSHNAMSCGAGWVLLQAIPVKFLGYGLTQLLLCLGSLAVIWQVAGKQLAMMLAAMITLCPGVWLSAANGADFLAFGIALTAMVVVVSKGSQSANNSSLFATAAVLIYQFRTPIVVMPGLLRMKLGVARSSAIALIAIAMQTAFFLWKPADYVAGGPMHLIRKAFGSTMFVDKPYLLILVVVMGTLCALAGALWVGKTVEPATASLGFVLLVLGVPAVVDLVRRLSQHISLMVELGSWEGGTWLAACLPITALVVLQSRFPPKERSAR